MKPKIELKNVKVAEFASEETHCYEATVYVDGRRFCIASNQGHGGPDSYDPLRPKGGWKDGGEAGTADRLLTQQIHLTGLRYNENAIERYPDGGFPTSTEAWEDDADKRHAAWEKEMAESAEVTTYQVFEHLVGNALTEALYAKDMKSAFRRKWIYTQGNGEVQLYEMARRKGADGERLQRVLREKHPEAQVLNLMPLEEALVLWRANG